MELKPITRKEIFLQKIIDNTAMGGSSGGVTINNQDKTITENGTYTADEGYTGLGTVTVDVQSGGDEASVLDSLIEGSITELTSNAESVGAYAMYGYKSITTVNFPIATDIGDNAFNGCSNLSTLNLPKVITIGNHAFRSDTSLKSAIFPKVTTIGQYAFGNCDALTTADFPELTSVGSNAFVQNKALTSISFPNLLKTNSAMFSGCEALTTVKLPKVTELVMTTFYQCYNLFCVDLPAVTTIGAQVFHNNRSIKRVILRSENLCSLANTNAFNYCFHITGETNSIYNPNGDKDGYIYVPSALIDTYKSATNWSTFATQFRALEDYTVDGTITGELDESKI